MKNLWLFFSSIFLFISCSSELEENPELGEITFSFSELERTISSSSNSSKLISDSSQLSTQNSSALTSNQDPSTILITIINSSNEIVANNQRITLFKFGNEFVTEAINLETGDYEISSFSILNNKNQVIYATPIANSPLAQSVSTPLNIPFNVSSNNTTFVVPDVITVLDTDNPELFGFVTFSFNVVNDNESVTPTFQAFIQNGSLDEFTFNVGENSDAFDITPPAGLQNNTGSFSSSPYRPLWNNTELDSYVNANFGSGPTRPISSSSGNEGTRGYRLNSSPARLYQLFNVEPGVEYTMSIDTRSETENTPLEIFMLNNEITTEVDILSNSDASFTVTNDFNTNTSSFTTSEFSFIASSNIAVFYARSLNTVDSSTEVFIDNISVETPGFSESAPSFTFSSSIDYTVKTFTNTTPNSGSVLWDIPEATFINGTSNTDETIDVIFPNSGDFMVTLQVSSLNTGNPESTRTLTTEVSIVNSFREIPEPILFAGSFENPEDQYITTEGQGRTDLGKEYWIADGLTQRVLTPGTFEPFSAYPGETDENSRTWFSLQGFQFNRITISSQSRLGEKAAAWNEFTTDPRIAVQRIEVIPGVDYKVTFWYNNINNVTDVSLLALILNEKVVSETEEGRELGTGIEGNIIAQGAFNELASGYVQASVSFNSGDQSAIKLYFNTSDTSGSYRLDDVSIAID